MLLILDYAVAWLVLLAGGTSKWADVSENGENALAAVELLLSSAIGFVAVSLIVLSLMNKRKAKKLVSRTRVFTGF